ncbi:MAG: AAA-like domain-containing protein [Leptolyngbyaceae cyanobacterium]
MSPEDAITLVDKLLSPYRLTAIQEVVFRRCWQGSTYAQIAATEGYDADYVRVTGSRLWQKISQVLGERVTKKNIHAVLRQQVHQLHQPSKPGPWWPGTDKADTTFPGSPLPLGSSFYIERPPVENQAMGELLKPGALLRVRAPERWGKTSLVNRLVAQAQTLNFKVVRLNFRQADGCVLAEFDKFLRWFCANIAQQLKLSTQLDDVWNADLGSKVSCTNYMQSSVLRSLQRPLLLVIDDLQAVFEHRNMAQEFLPMLRVWHEEAKNLTEWGYLRLLVAYATEAYIPLQIHQSPFNVGLPLRLPAFTLDQTQQLAQRYGVVWDDGLSSLHTLVEVHPYLVHLALYNLSVHHMELARLIDEAPQQSGIYSDHLRSYLAIFEAEPELARMFYQVIEQETATELEPMAAYRLESMGLVTLMGNTATASCNLYRKYFGGRLSIDI